MTRRTRNNEDFPPHQEEAGNRKIAHGADSDHRPQDQNPQNIVQHRAGQDGHPFRGIGLFDLVQDSSRDPHLSSGQYGAHEQGGGVQETLSISVISPDTFATSRITES